MNIVDLSALDVVQLQHLAAISHAASQEHSRAWLPTIDAALEEIEDARGKYTRVAVEGDTPLGWVSAAHSWGRLWEVHPLVVGIEHQKRGVGRVLVREVEAEAARNGALTLCLSTSDTTHATSLSDVDLFDDPLRRLSEFRVRVPHAIQFWMKLGFQIVGVTPDAEAVGEPSIHLAKRVATS